MAQNCRWEGDDGCEGWSEFPTNVNDWNSLYLDGRIRAERLRSLSEVVFSDVDIDLEIFQFHGSSCEGQRYSTEADILGKLRRKTSPGLRMIAIAQDFSLGPLNITLQCMLKLLTMLKVSPDFVSVLLKFGSQPHVFEEGSTVVSCSEPIVNCLDISYQFTFMQPNGRTLPKDPWSLRQIGLYSRCCSKPSFSSFIVLFPTPLDESEVYSRLKNEGPSGTSATSFENNPINVHLLFLATYLHNWQTYLEVLADDFRTMRDRIATIDISNEDDYDLKTSSLKTLREIEDKLLFRVQANLRSNLAVINTLRHGSERLKELRIIDDKQLSSTLTCLQSFENQTKSHMSSAETLEKRLTATIGLLSNLLNLKNQKTAELINGFMLRLTRETMDDNVTVYVITFVSLVYLPSQYIATLLGMNLFEFAGDGGLRTSPALWIYFLTAVPLTVLTIIFWRYQVRRQTSHRQQRQEKFEQK